MPDISLYERQIRELLSQGNKIAAIKLYREGTGVGLKEAKDAVEAIERGEPTYSPEPIQIDLQNDALLDEQIKQLLTKRQKIQAIRFYREINHTDLKDAKDAVDAIEARMRRENRINLQSAPTIGDDPFAEDAQRNRTFLILLIAVLVLVIGGLAFFVLAGNGF